MRRRSVAIVVVGLAGLAWWLWPRSEAPVETITARKKAPTAKVQRFRQTPKADPDMASAAQGAFGPEMQKRVCDLCEAGMLDRATCSQCEDEPPATGTLVVDLIDEDGRPAERGRVQVRNCDVVGREAGVYRVLPGICEVFAFRRDGALWARSDRVDVEILEGDEAYVQVELKSARTGGLGVSIGRAEQGIRVLAVMPGTPAAEVGLEAGDVIVEVDGMATSELGLQEFIQTMTGPEESEVDFVVQFETDTGLAEEPVSIVRKFLEPSG